MPQKGLLYSLEKLTGHFNVSKDSRGEHYLHFDIPVQDKGINAVIRIFGEIIKEKYVQLIQTKIISTTSNIGEKRMELITNYLEKLLFDEKYLLPQHEVKDGYAYGMHYLETKNVYRKKATFLQKVCRDDLELLLTEKGESQGFGKTYGFEKEFYYWNGQLFFRKTEADKAASNTEMAFQSDFLEGLSVLSGCYNAIDEEGRIYYNYDVFDNSNIRILQKSTLGEISVKEIFSTNSSGYVPGATFNEIIKELKESKKPILEDWDNPKLPLTIDTFTIYSKRVLGESIPEFKPGTWIVLEEKQDYYLGGGIPKGTFGKVIEQSGNHLCIVWDFNYAIEKNWVHYRYVSETKNPFLTLEKPEFTSFAKTFSNNDIKQRGFGLIIERSPNVSKIIPLDGVTRYLEKHYTITEKFHSDYLDEAGEYLDFILVPNEEIKQESFSNEFISYIQSFETIGNVEYQAIHTLLSLPYLNGNDNADYFSLICSYLIHSGEITFPSLILELTQNKIDILNAKIDQDNDIKEWLFERLKTLNALIEI